MKKLVIPSLEELHKAGIFRRKISRLLTWEQVLKRDEKNCARLKYRKTKER